LIEAYCAVLVVGSGINGDGIARGLACSMRQAGTVPTRRSALCN
jgi:hypothetical protein